MGVIMMKKAHLCSTFMELMKYQKTAIMPMSI